MNRRNERQKGFTLIELLVVLIIIAVLAAVLVPALTSYVDDAREKKAVSEAQVCVTAATEWAAVQRTALISQAYQSNKPFADAYKAAADTAKWSTDYDALNTAAPTVTGTLALAEGDGQYFLRPESAPNTDTTTDTMKATVKTAAGVDGKLQKMQLNADGKVLYLLYTSAEGIPVAYTAAGAAQTPDTTIPVAKLPEDTTPTPSEPDHSGDLVFCVRDEYTGKPVPGIKFHVEDLSGKTVFGSQTTDKNGMVYFDLDPAELTNHFMQFKLVPEDWPEGYQQVFYVEFSIDAFKSTYDKPFDSYIIQGITYNKNHETAKYKKEEVGKLEGGADRHLCTFYVRSVPTLELCVWDDDNGNYLKGVEFTLSNGTKSTTIPSGLSPTLLDVQLHTEDKPRPGHEVIDLSSGNFFGNWLVNFTKVPEGYQYFDKCNITIRLQNQDGHENQLYTEFQSGQQFDGKPSNTVITYKNLSDQNKCVVTIHVKGGKKVKFFVYDGLDNEHTTQLPNAKMELYDSKNAKIATFTTDKDGNPTGAGSFTKTLSEGEYTLHLVSGTPTDYTQPADITFKVERVNGLLTLTGDAAYVDNTNSSVTMLVTKPNTMRFKLQVVDANTKQPWAGVNVKVTGNSLQATDDSKRYYAIDSSANNTHTIDLDLLKSGDIKVTIVGSDNKDSDFEDGYHNDSYTNNFVGSKYVFNLNKNENGTFTLTEKSGKEGFNGEINGNTVMVYAYPRLLVDFKCTNTSHYSPGSAVIRAYLQIYNTNETPASTKDGKNIQEWEVKAENRNYAVGLSMGNYKLHETEKIGPRFKRLNLPLSFTIGQTDKGFPALMDSSGKIVDNDDFSNNPLKITALYEYVLKP